MKSSPLVSVIVWPLSAGSNWIMSPSLAAAIAPRSEPGPLSFMLVTVIVVACAGIATAQTNARQIVSMLLLFTPRLGETEFYTLALG